MDEITRPTTPRHRQPLTRARQRLAERFLPLARAIAQPHKQAWPWASDEFESAANMALVEAAESFDPHRKVRFATYARHRIHGAMQDVKRRLAPGGWRSDAAHAPTIGPLCENPERWGRVLNTEPDPPVDEALCALEEVDFWLNKLPKKHAEACRRIYIHGKTQAETARELGYSQSRLSCMHREAIAMLNGSWYDFLAENRPAN